MLSTTTWNPSDKSAGITLSGGNLVATASSTGGTYSVRATNSITSGKHYFEITVDICSAAVYIGVGTAALSLASNVGVTGSGWSINNSGNKYKGSSGAYGPPYNTFTDHDIVQVAIDYDAGKIWWTYNGHAWPISGNPATGANPAWDNVDEECFPMVSLGADRKVTVNFGATAFAYTPPTGYNVSETIIAVPAIAEAATFVAPGVSNTKVIPAIATVDTFLVPTSGIPVAGIIPAIASTDTFPVVTYAHIRKLTPISVSDAFQIPTVVITQYPIPIIYSADTFLPPRIKGAKHRDRVWTLVRGKHLALDFEDNSLGGLTLQDVTVKLERYPDTVNGPQMNVIGNHLALDIENAVAGDFTLNYLIGKVDVFKER